MITESTAKTVAAQPKSLDSLAKVVLVIGKPLIVFQRSKVCVCATANTTCCTWINTSGEVETQLPKITKKATLFTKMSPSMWSFFNLFDLCCFGSWGLWFLSALQMLGIILLIVVLIVSLVVYILSKALNACVSCGRPDK